MNFLKKLGSVLLNVVGIVTGVGPLINRYLPAKAATTEATVIDKLTSIAQIVVTAEQMITASSDAGAKTGAQKLAAARPFVKQLVLSSELVAGHHVQDDAMLTAGVDQIIGGVVAVLNSLQPPDVNIVKPQDAVKT